MITDSTYHIINSAGGYSVFATGNRFVNANGLIRAWSSGTGLLPPIQDAKRDLGKKSLKSRRHPAPRERHREYCPDLPEDCVDLGLAGSLAALG